VVEGAGWHPEVQVDGGVLVSALKPGRTVTGHVIRLYESTGRPGSVRIGSVPRAAKVSRVSIVEDHEADIAVHDGWLTLDLGPFEVVTLRVEGAG